MKQRLANWRAAAEGHLWTIAPLCVWSVWPDPMSPARPWRFVLDDAHVGRVTLTGAMHDHGSDTVLVAVHGLGGDIDSHYIHRAAIAAERAGIDCLRLNLRGADLSGDDFYHAGLIADLQAAIASPELARHRRILLLGYSLGGHLAMRYAAARPDKRLTAVAAICPPLDLASAVRDMDAPARWAYRRHVLGALKAMLPVARRPLPLPLGEALRIERLRDWDERLVVPRFGFASVDRYYQDESAMHYLEELSVNTLIVAAEHDPMVLAKRLAPILEERSGKARTHLTACWLTRAGHVGFPPNTSLGLTKQSASHKTSQRTSQRTSLEIQAVTWLLSQSEQE